MEEGGDCCSEGAPLLSCSGVDGADWFRSAWASSGGLLLCLALMASRRFRRCSIISASESCGISLGSAGTVSSDAVTDSLSGMSVGVSRSEAEIRYLFGCRGADFASTDSATDETLALRSGSSGRLS